MMDISDLKAGTLYEMPTIFCPSVERRPLILEIGECLIPVSDFLAMAQPLDRRRKEYVVGFMFDPTSSMVLLIRKSKPEWQKGKYNGVGGKIEPGESPKAAMVREFWEEASVSTSPSDWRPVAVYQGAEFRVYFFASWSDDLYYAEARTAEPLVRAHVDDISDYEVIFNLQWLIPLALDKHVDKPLLIEEPVTPADQVH